MSKRPKTDEIFKATPRLQSRSANSTTAGTLKSESPIKATFVSGAPLRPIGKMAAGLANTSSLKTAKCI
jgi:hypothetical protein